MQTAAGSLGLATLSPIETLRPREEHRRQQVRSLEILALLAVTRCGGVQCGI